MILQAWQLYRLADRKYRKLQITQTLFCPPFCLWSHYNKDSVQKSGNIRGLPPFIAGKLPITEILQLFSLVYAMI